MAAEVLTAAVEITRRLAAAGGPDDVLAVTAAAVGDTLGMQTVVNKLRPESDEFEVTFVHRAGPAVTALLGERYDEEQMLRLLDPRYAQDGVFVLPHDAPLWDDFEGAFVDGTPHMGPGDGSWHPDDSIVIPLRDISGRVLALVSADEPSDHRRPTPERLLLTTLIAQTAATTFEARLLAAAAVEAARETAELSYLSASLAVGLDEREILQRAVDGVCAACGFDLAAVGLFDYATGAVRLQATAGPGARLLAGGTLEPAEVNRILDPANLVGDSYLVANTDGARPIGPLLYETRANAAGVRGWNHHTLAVPLETGSGAPLGLLFVDEPHDRLLPSTDKIRRLEIFARQAALLVDGARRLASAREEAVRDAMTGLGNARAFEAVIAERLDDETPLALVCVDLDGFKSVNDAQGHLVGDALLKAFGESVRAALPEGGEAFRLGGDEFTLVLPTGDTSLAAETVDALRSDAVEHGVRFSAGIALAPRHADDAQGLRAAADAALYAAKRAGRDRTAIATRDRRSGADRRAGAD